MHDVTVTLTSLAPAAVIGQLAKPSTLPELVGWQNTSAVGQRSRTHVQSAAQGGTSAWTKYSARAYRGTNVRVQPPVTVVAHWPFAWHWRPMLPVHPGVQYAPCT